MFSGGFFDFSVLVMTMMKMTSLSVSVPWMATVLAVPEGEIVTEICQLLLPSAALCLQGHVQWEGGVVGGDDVDGQYQYQVADVPPVPC